MYSVTGRIKMIRQPRGGYINREAFSVTELHDERTLHEEENTDAGIVGLAVDYLTRFVMGSPVEKAFAVSLKGAEMAREEGKANSLLASIRGLDDRSIAAACKLAGYDVVYRAGVGAFRSIDVIDPDKKMIENIRIMVERSKEFWKEYGPIVKDGFTMDGGYTTIISAGDGDYLTEDTLWEFKTLRKEPESGHRLQVLIYYLMGLHSVCEEFKTISKLGIYNPRKNKVYLIDVASIPQEVIDEVSKKVIGYGLTKEEYRTFLTEHYSRMGMTEDVTAMLVKKKLSEFRED